MAPAATVVQHDRNKFISTNDLRSSIFGGKVPETEEMRRHFGRGLTPQTIESVIRSAELGYMRDVTDLTYETMFLDPSFGNVACKRSEMLAAIDPKVVAASGDGIDEKLAEELADEVRQNLFGIRSFKQKLVQLGWGHCFGRAALELEWREQHTKMGVRWRVKSMNWIHPRRLQFGPKRELRVCDSLFTGRGFDATGMALSDYPAKFIEYTPQLFNDYPEREGYGPRALYYAFFKRFGWRERLVLMEVFGKPWRIVTVKDGAQVQREALDAAEDQADGLGANATAVFGPGLQLVVAQPDPKGDEAHQRIQQDADAQIAKLVLGQERTSEAKSSGLGSQDARVQQDEQILKYTGDGQRVGQCLKEHLATPIAILNYGDDPAIYAHVPSIELDFQIPPPRSQEITDTKNAVSVGVPLKLDEVYAKLGFSKPDADDEVIQQSGGGGGPFGNAGPTPSVGEVRGGSGNFPADGEGGGRAEPPLASVNRSLARRLRIMRMSPPKPPATSS